MLHIGLHYNPFCIFSFLWALFRALSTHAFHWLALYLTLLQTLFIPCLYVHPVSVHLHTTHHNNPENHKYLSMVMELETYRGAI
jgi:hypothetical protein